jgi:xanthine/CO dehydrogenase XdhC/CoxF family maturation factor
MYQNSEDILGTAETWRAEGRAAVLATVMETWGSAPRPAGAHMLVDGAGRFAGSICGGCVEGAVVAAALEILTTGAPRVMEFGVADESAWSVGLSCGGRIRVYLERID